MESKRSDAQDIQTALDAVKKIIGRYDNPEREGLLDTPRRYIKFLDEFTSPPKVEYTMFSAEGYREMVLVKDIMFYSLCEHHLAPFFGTAKIAYLPDEYVVGISKLPRTLEAFARKFQNQERITKQVGESIWQAIKPRGVAVELTAQHLCMSMRGVRAHGANTTTSFYLGEFQHTPDLVNNFLNA